jgi:hypothetical protein
VLGIGSLFCCTQLVCHLWSATLQTPHPNTLSGLRRYPKHLEVQPAAVGVHALPLRWQAGPLVLRSRLCKVLVRSRGTSPAARAGASFGAAAAAESERAKLPTAPSDAADSHREPPAPAAAPLLRRPTDCTNPLYNFGPTGDELDFTRSLLDVPAVGLEDDFK